MVGCNMYKFLIMLKFEMAIILLLFLSSCLPNTNLSKNNYIGLIIDDYIFVKNKDKDYIIINFNEYYYNGKEIYYEIVKEDSLFYIKRYDLKNNLMLYKKIKDYEYEAYFNYNFNKIDTSNIYNMITHHYKYHTSVEIYYDNQRYYFVFLDSFIPNNFSKNQIEQFTYFNYLKGLLLDYEMYFDPEFITPFDGSYNLLEYLRNEGVKVDKEFDFNKHLRLRGFKENEYLKK